MFSGGEVWNKEFCGVLSERIRKVVEESNNIDLIDERGLAGDLEFVRKRVLLADFWKLSYMNESLLMQRSRSRWIKEGDRNSGYFNAAINKRRVSD